MGAVVKDWFLTAIFGFYTLKSGETVGVYTNRENRLICTVNVWRLRILLLLIGAISVVAAVHIDRALIDGTAYLTVVLVVLLVLTCALVGFVMIRTLFVAFCFMLGAKESPSKIEIDTSEAERNYTEIYKWAAIGGVIASDIWVLML